MTDNNNKLNSAFGLTAIGYLLSLTLAPYPLQFAFKALPILLLLLLVLRSASSQANNQRLLAIALLASATGDILLALPLNNGLLFGLGAFLIAQLIYTVSFIRQRTHERLAGARKISAGLIAVFAMCMAFYLLPDTANMMVPVAIYLVVITCMAISAILSGLHFWVIIGALSFLSSDTMLALSLFKTPLPFSEYLVMISYYCAQFFIINGMLKSQNNG